MDVLMENGVGRPVPTSTEQAEAVVQRIHGQHLGTSRPLEEERDDRDAGGRKVLSLFASLGNQSGEPCHKRREATKKRT